MEIRYQKHNITSYKPTAGWNQEIHTFPKGINPKVNIMTQKEFKFASYDFAVQHVSPYAPGLPPKKIYD